MISDSWRFELIIIFLILTFLILFYCCKRYIQRLGQKKENNCRQVLITIKEHLEKDKLKNVDNDKNSIKRSDGTAPILDKFNRNKIDQALSDILLTADDTSEQILYSLPARRSPNISLHSNDTYLTNIVSHQTKDSSQITINLEQAIDKNDSTIPSTPSCTHSVNENSRI